MSLDEYRVEQVVRRERFYRDTNRWEEWRGCYHPDSSKTFIDISWFKGHIDDFVERSRAIHAAGVAPSHFIAPTDVSIRGSRALCTSVAQIHTRFEYSGAEYDLIADLRLVSRLECLVDVGWKMVSLEGIYLQDRIVPVFPSAKAADFAIEDMKDPRPSYKCLIWNIERRGLTARRDLPGIDMPEAVRAMMGAHEQWLEAPPK